MAGVYLTKAHKQQILDSNWNMVIGEIEREIELVEQKPALKKRLPLLHDMLKSAQAREFEGNSKSARKLCRLSRKVPPGCYYQSTKAFKFSGQRVTLPKNDAAWSLHRVHPQIYR